jgi:hypothetical protein
VARWRNSSKKGYTSNLTVIIHYDTLSQYLAIASKLLNKETNIGNHPSLDSPKLKLQLLFSESKEGGNRFMCFAGRLF